MPRVLTDAEIDDFRDRLCEAATRMFADRGFEGFTMRELAAALDVSPMTPYRYFRDKEAILAAVRTRAFDRFSEALEAGFAAPGDAVTRATGAGRAYIDFAIDNPQAYRLMFDIAQIEEEEHPDLSRATERARGALTRHIHPLIEAGIVKGDAQLLGHVFWAMLHGAIMLKLADKLAPDCDLDELLDKALVALTTGFSPEHSAG